MERNEELDRWYPDLLDIAANRVYFALVARKSSANIYADATPTNHITFRLRPKRPTKKRDHIGGLWMFNSDICPNHSRLAVKTNSSSEGQELAALGLEELLTRGHKRAEKHCEFIIVSQSSLRWIMYLRFPQTIPCWHAPRDSDGSKQCVCILQSKCPVRKTGIFNFIFHLTTTIHCAILRR